MSRTVKAFPSGKKSGCVRLHGMCEHPDLYIVLYILSSVITRCGGLWSMDIVLVVGIGNLVAGNTYHGDLTNGLVCEGVSDSVHGS